MRGKFFLATGVLVGLLAFGTLAPTASAHPPRDYGYYYGRGAHDFVSHGHSFSTPLGTFEYYGRGLHDRLPHGHYVPARPYDGYYPVPHGSSHSHRSPSHYGDRYYHGR